MALDPVSLDYPVVAPQNPTPSRTAGSTTFAVATTGAAGGEVLPSQGPGILDTASPEAVQAMLSGVYRAPTLSLPLPLPARRKETLSKELFWVQVMKPEAIVGMREYASGGASESIIARRTSPNQHSVQGTHELLVQHHVDLIA